MTLIAFTANKIYTDRSATTSVISRTNDRKIVRLGKSILVGTAGLALTEAELACLTPLIPQILAVRTPHEAYDLLDELVDIFSKSGLDTTLLLVTRTRYIIVQLGRFRNNVDLFTRAEMDGIPMAIGSGALQFIHNLELTGNVVDAVKAAVLADPHCGRDVFCIDIEKLGTEEEDPPFTPRPKPKKQTRGQNRPVLLDFLKPPVKS